MRSACFWGRVKFMAFFSVYEVTVDGSEHLTPPRLAGCLNHQQYVMYIICIYTIHIYIGSIVDACIE